MSEEKKTDASKKDTDEELSNLLESALEDFSDKKPPAKTEEAKKDDEAEVPEAEGDLEWSEEFLRQATQRFQEDISRLCEQVDPSVSFTPEQIQESFQKMAEAAQTVLSNPTAAAAAGAPGTDGAPDFTAAITQTLKGLSEGTENLQNPFSNDDLLNMFTGGGNAGEPNQNGFVPFMQGMMQSLLSKEVLYPSLKEIVDKYPEWLAANAAALPQHDRQRYENQRRLMEDVCRELEAEAEADAPAARRERFERVLDLMQRLQDHGQPPADLVGDVGPAAPFDRLGNPAGGDQCSVM